MKDRISLRSIFIGLSIVGLLASMTGLMAYKIHRWGYRLDAVAPKAGHRVTVRMQFSGFSEDLRVRTFLPKNDARQTVRQETQYGPGLTFFRQEHEPFVEGVWSKKKAEGAFVAAYTFDVDTQAVTFDIDPELRVPDRYPERLRAYLKPTDVVQSRDPLIRHYADTLKDPRGLIKATLHNIHAHVQGLNHRPFKGTTDALTTAKLGEASCNGKSRLFVALSRAAGIPARLVGGLIMQPGTKRTSHQWVETYVEGHWIPFDALNNHEARLPAHYLTLYRGDEAMFRHTKDIGFDYHFDIETRLMPNAALLGFLERHPMNVYYFLQFFEQLDISLSLLRLVLLLPFGTLAVVLARNVIGMRTMGTFLPALMAIAVRQTGFAAGVFAFVFVISIAFLARKILDVLGVLHTAKLAILMVVVILSILGLTVFASVADIKFLAGIGGATLFPVAILTLTSERVAVMIEETGFFEAGQVFAQTLIVMGAAYALMSSLALEALVLAFPEMLLGVLALDLWVGTWMGIRVLELIRFKDLIFSPEYEEASI